MVPYVLKPLLRRDAVLLFLPVNFASSFNLSEFILFGLTLYHRLCCLDLMLPF